jgi:hypothetical protein
MKHAAALTILLLVACGGRDAQSVRSVNTASQPATVQTSAPAKAMTPEQLGELGAQIRKEPTRAHELLASHGLDEQQFEQAIRNVTENADASKRYAAAYRKASS